MCAEVAELVYAQDLKSCAARHVGSIPALGTRMNFVSENIKLQKPNYAVYRVDLKVLLKKGDEFLFLEFLDGEKIDLPGGRIDVGEENTSLEEIIAREIKEELGEEVKYILGKPVFQYRVFLKERGWSIFLTIYEAEYLSGEIKLSDEHSDYKWVNPKNIYFKEENFFCNEEYLAFKKYFDGLKK